MKKRNKQKSTDKKATVKSALGKPTRNYKDRVFRIIFKDKQKLLELYNAVNGTNYQNAEDMTITTLDNAIYLGMKNDISFVLYDQLALYEHQSTNDPNMPLRNLFYVSDVYSGLVYKEELHSRKQVKIPEPKFLVFYNGTEDMPERWEQKLSDAYPGNEEDPALELRTTVLNINLGKNQELADKCRPLLEYMILVGKIRKYNEVYPIEQAVEMAVDDCIREGIMADFLLKNRAEVVKMSIYEYNQDKIRHLDRKEGLEEGLEKGLEEGLEWLVKAVYIKLEKRKTIDVIKEELEIDVAVVEKIVLYAEPFVGKYDWTEVRGKIMNKCIAHLMPVTIK